MKCPKCNSPIELDSDWTDGTLYLRCSDNDWTIGPVCDWDIKLEGDLLAAVNKCLDSLPQEVMSTNQQEE